MTASTTARHVRRHWLRASRGDYAALLLAALAIVAAASLYRQPQTPANWVEVRSQGQLLGRYALDEPRDLAVTGPLGTSHLQIRDGRVRFLSSPCARQVCVHAGWLRWRGDGAACLPNGISLRLGSDAGAAIDATSP